MVCHFAERHPLRKAFLRFRTSFHLHGNVGDRKHSILAMETRLRLAGKAGDYAL
jgi:hypothetical protein